MDVPVLYRRRLMPNECIRLDKDQILFISPDCLVTSWNAIRPRNDLKRGVSAYFWKRGVKLSKFYDHQDQLLFWYCDIFTHEYDPVENSYRYLDLLADVLIYPDGKVKVVDLDELADASQKGLITLSQLQLCLYQLNWLLETIDSGEIRQYQNILEEKETWT